MVKKRIIKKAACCLAFTAVFCLTGCGGTKEAEKADVSAEPVLHEEEQITEADYCGSFFGEKYIDAMGCNVEITITIEKDGTYTYYRAPMSVDLEGGGEMPAMEDSGSCQVKDSEMTFSGEALGDFSASFKKEEEGIYLEGNLPTGGAVTDMILSKVSTGE